jgi:hypothetical protein
MKEQTTQKQWPEPMTHMTEVGILSNVVLPPFESALEEVWISMVIRWVRGAAKGRPDFHLRERIDRIQHTLARLTVLGD